MKKKEDFRKQTKPLRTLVLVSGLMILFIAFLGVALILNPAIFSSGPKQSEIPGSVITNTDPEVDDWNRIENGIHVRTGLKDAEGLMAVVNNCTNCHSAELVMQNRMNRERWIETIRWMQETQNLWNLGENEEIILNYLVTNYPIINTGRRAPLSHIEWYSLNE
ncbi:MAG TPA: hypothetical protein VLZ54_01855 [Arenibacter sp.]|nr:hypothetical protein [Arenibacter sp.]